MTSLIASARLAADWHARQALDRANRCYLSSNPPSVRNEGRRAAMQTARLFYMAKPDLWLVAPHEHHYEAVPCSSSNHPMVWCHGCFRLAPNPGTTE